MHVYFRQPKSESQELQPRFGQEFSGSELVEDESSFSIRIPISEKHTAILFGEEVDVPEDVDCAHSVIQQVGYNDYVILDSSLGKNKVTYYFKGLGGQTMTWWKYDRVAALFDHASATEAAEALDGLLQSEKDMGVSLDQYFITDRLFVARHQKELMPGGRFHSIFSACGQEAVEMLKRLEGDTRAIDMVAELAATLTKKQMGEVLFHYNWLSGAGVYAFVHDIANYYAERGVPVDKKILAEGFSHKARNFLFDVMRVKKQKQKVGTYLRRISLERHDDLLQESSAIMGSVERISEALQIEYGEDILLADIKGHQEGAERYLSDTNNTGLLVETLHAQHKLKPIPEIHWRVDRNLQEHERRIGFSLTDLLHTLKDGSRKKIFLEFGPGSGKSKEERKQLGFGTYFEDFALADTLYYPVKELVSNFIDWTRVDRAVGVLSDEEKGIFSDMIYKLIMIRDGQTSQDTFEYATERIAAITKDPDILKQYVIELVPQLLKQPTATAVPDTISTRADDGSVHYPYAVDLTARSRSLSFVQARILFAEKPMDFLRPDIDTLNIYSVIPAYPVGTMIEDFSAVERLRDNQIDVAWGIRSTVYKRGEEYIDFMNTVVDKLADGGVYIDDNVRDNDGWYYRLAELMRVQSDVQKAYGGDVSFHLILGPGFPGEDVRQDRVPLGIAIAKKNAALPQQLSLLLKQSEGFSLTLLDAYVADAEQLKTLDRTGKVYASVADAAAESVGDRKAA